MSWNGTTQCRTRGLSGDTRRGMKTSVVVKDWGCSWLQGLHLRAPSRTFQACLAPRLRLAPARRLTLQGGPILGDGFPSQLFKWPQDVDIYMGRRHSQGHPHISPAQALWQDHHNPGRFPPLHRLVKELEPRPQDVSPRQGPSVAGTLIHMCGHRRHRGKETSRCGMLDDICGSCCVYTLVNSPSFPST